MSLNSYAYPDWSPFIVLPLGQRGEPPRPIHTMGGVGDRMRAAAFAEIQARDAFRWAAQTFANHISPELQSVWLETAQAEHKHLHWLLKRMEELQINVQERPVSAELWKSFLDCKDAKTFALYMASAEERGRRAGERFYDFLISKDKISAEIFKQIAIEEVEHIQIAERFFSTPQPNSKSEFSQLKEKIEQNNRIY